ncbi:MULTISPECIES: ArsR/SmtB family transcription factor [Lysobacter]|nr:MULTISPECIES: metalloregulator ArsR/SmtB family transcription factor [Lysobacter]QCW27275.1 helix-turn-helix transcriptional regulator [Lysobacter enzymogenes]QQQ03847.1 helix-turn-helix transcriptional regulator [Lysobacter enzymogenes]WMT05847.1 metalloregulator ArsR/SmtB family transcription factor [Lysobacter yananisis]
MEILNASRSLAALGHASRLAIFRQLVEAGHGGRMAGELAQALSMPGATLSFHLKELVAAGLILGEARGRYVNYRADFSAMNELIAFLTRNCCAGDAQGCGTAAPARPPRRAAAAKARSQR